MGARPILGLLSLAIVAAGIVLQFFVILSGAISGNPVNKVYFLQAATNGISGARNPSRWTFFAICGADGENNANCGAIVPALPFDPPRNFGTEDGVADDFINTKRFYLMSRFMFAFYLMALVFASFSLCTGLLALCSRIGGYLSGLNTMIALGFQAVSAALMTVWVVEARNAFRKNDQPAKIGKYGMGFTWGAAAAFLVATVLFCISGGVGKDHATHSRGGGRFSRFGRKRRTDYDSQRGMMKA